MSEAMPTQDQTPAANSPSPAAHPTDSPVLIKEALEILQRLASLISGVPPPSSVLSPQHFLDAALTTEQTAHWLQLDCKTVNALAKEKVLPSIPINKQKSRFRFHPRSIIADAKAAAAVAQIVQRKRGRRPVSFLKPQQP